MLPACIDRQAPAGSALPLLIEPRSRGESLLGSLARVRSQIGRSLDDVGGGATARVLRAGYRGVSRVRGGVRSSAAEL